MCYPVNLAIPLLTWLLLNIAGQFQLWKWIGKLEILGYFSYFETQSLRVPVLCLWVQYPLLHSRCHRLPLSGSFSLCVSASIHHNTPLPSLPLLLPLHLCAQGSSEACSWLRPPLLWAKDSAGGQGSGSSLKKSRQIKDKRYWGRKK